MIELLKNRFSVLFSKHYVIERFGILFCVLCIAMSGCLLSITGKINRDKKEQLGVQAVYTTQFTMSKSHATGSVVSVNTSNDKTKCLVLLKYDDPTKMATTADAYSMFLTGSNLKRNRTELLCSPVGSVYVFGNSGYVALYLVDTNGFSSQILDLTVRSINSFEAPEGPIADADGDGSFEQFDQARIYFNPGAEGATSVTCLESDTLTAYNIYESVLIQKQEKSIRTQMDEALQELKQAQISIEAAEKVVEEKQLQLPETPYQIAGDYVTDDGEGHLELITTYSLRGAHEFDWRNGSIKDGYIDDILAATGYSTASEYFASKPQEHGETFTTYNTVWYTVDGTRYTPDGVNGASASEQLTIDAMNALTSAWQSFYDAKLKYTVTLPSQLLDLEVLSKEITSNYTVKTDVDTLLTY